VGLRDAAGVGITSLAKVRIHDIVAGTVSGTPSIFIANIGE